MANSSQETLTLGLFLRKLVCHGQPYLVYPAAFLPRPRSLRKPSSYNLPYTDISIPTSDNIQLKCYLIKPSTATIKATVVMFHGNGMDHSDLLYHARRYHSFRCNVLTVSYRGYGESEGVPTEKGLRKDAQAVVDWISNDEQLSRLPIIIYGLSLGGAVAIDVTSKNADKIAALILENTFTSIPNIVHAWPLIGPLSFLCTQRWNSAAKLSRIPPTLPIMFCSGRKDTVVPPVHMDNLWKIAGERGKRTKRAGGCDDEGKKGIGVGMGMGGCGGLLCTSTSGGIGLKGGEIVKEEEEWTPPENDLFVSFPGGGHVDTCTRQTYWSQVDKFITKSLSLSS